MEINCKLPLDISAQLTSTQSDLVAGLKEEMLFNAYLPGFQRQELSHKQPAIRIAHTEGTPGTDCLQVDGGSVTLRDEWKGKISLDLYHLFYSVARLQFLKQGYYAVHAASVGPSDGDQILLVGHTGSGKTTAALDLANTRGWQLASGNKSLVTFDPESNLRVCAGTRTMTVRESELEKFSSIVGENIFHYSDRVAFSLNEDHFTSRVARVKAVALIRFHDGLESVTKLASMTALHTMYPYFMDTVNADTIVAGGRAVFSGAVPRQVSQHLAPHLEKAFQKIDMYSIAGSREFVVKTVSEL